MQQRYYDPLVGRFLGVDPAQSELNTYNYASNNPYRFVDVDGRAAQGTAPSPDPEPHCDAECKRKHQAERNKKSDVYSVTTNDQNDDESTVTSANDVVDYVVQGVTDWWKYSVDAFEASDPVDEVERNLFAIPADAMLLQGFQAARPLFVAGRATAAGRVIFSTAHYAPRLEAAGLNVQRVEGAVRALAEANRRNLVVGEWQGARTTIDGVLIQYNMFLQSTGVISVSTIYPVLPKAP